MTNIKYPKLAFLVAFVVTFALLGVLKDEILNNEREPVIVTGNYTSLLIDDRPTIYHSPKCSVCVRLLAYLDQQGVSYGKKNIDESRLYSQEFQQLNINTVPLIITASYAIVDFHKDEVDKLFNNNKIEH